MAGSKLNRQHSNKHWLAVVAASFVSSASLASEPTSADSRLINYSLDRQETSFSSAGLVRFLEERSEAGGAANPATIEDVATSTLVAEEKSAEEKSAAERVSEGSPIDRPTFEELQRLSTLQSTEIAKVPITLAPLVTPNTIVAGIGTGALPEDMVAGRLPNPIGLPTGTTRSNPHLSETKAWVPGGFCHQPLYWENPMLERHGHQTHPMLQPAISGVRFYGTFLVLPYLATLRDPLADVHTLGAYRPGSPAPALRYRAHYDSKALRNQVIMSGAATAISAP
jgi:hypothetical protein